jgi:hypothetical protein
MGKPAWEQAKSSQDEITAALMNRSASAAALGEWYVGVLRPAGLHQDEQRSLLFLLCRRGFLELMAI